jgi:hypothetical protein
MQPITSRHDERYKQLNGCHIQVLHIFLIKFHIENILFRVTVWKIWILQDWNKFCHFSENRNRTETFLTEVKLDSGADAWGQLAGRALLLECLTSGSRLSEPAKESKKVLLRAKPRNRTQDLVERGTTLRPPWYWIGFDQIWKPDIILIKAKRLT